MMLTFLLNFIAPLFPLLELIFFYLICSCVFVWIGVYVCIHKYHNPYLEVKRQPVEVGSLLLLNTMWVLAVKLRSSGLAVTLRCGSSMIVILIWSSENYSRNQKDWYKWIKMLAVNLDSHSPIPRCTSCP